MTMAAKFSIPVAFALLCLQLLAVPTAIALDREPIPAGITAKADKGDIIEATLIGKTDRYKHFVLGTNYEAAGIRVRNSSGQTLELMLPEDSVFEDRQPRIADLDGDGRNEVIVVRSRLSTGSALAVLGVRDGKLKVLAETTPNGGPRRWLNPAGIADFYGTGKKQIALVRMPHAVGKLEFWDFDGAAMHLLGSLDNTSNHRIGTDILKLAAVAPRGNHKAGERGDLLVIPSFDRRSLRLISALPKPHSLADVTLDAAVTGDTVVRAGENGLTADVKLANGSTQSVNFAHEILQR